MPWTLEARTLCATPTCTQPKRHGGECDGDTPTEIRVGDRVSLVISSEPDDVTGTVTRVYADAIGSPVADVELRDGEIFPQNVEFLTRVGGNDTPTYAQTVTALAREYRGSAVDGEVPPSVHFRITTELHAAAARAGIDADTANEDFAEEVQAVFVEAA